MGDRQAHTASQRRSRCCIAQVGAKVPSDVQQATIEAYNFPVFKKMLESKADMLAHKHKIGLSVPLLTLLPFQRCWAERHDGMKLDCDTLIDNHFKRSKQTDMPWQMTGIGLVPGNPKQSNLRNFRVNQSGVFVAVGAPTVSQLKLQPESPDSGLREPVFQLSKSLRMITC
ncbi:hypothetical protein HAX54_052431 [Datura stramonium]|uniref:Uncharacterized protein n=1 Tax=Datura stramonium TaxID=4076 RepID=A0ABS8RV20_DATST|nr:hypothetical protein [Datura stramonium]